MKFVRATVVALDGTKLGDICVSANACGRKIALKQKTGGIECSDVACDPSAASDTTPIADCGLCADGTPHTHLD